jgi:hypothetical protein
MEQSQPDLPTDLLMQRFHFYRITLFAQCSGHIFQLIGKARSCICNQYTPRQASAATIPTAMVPRWLFISVRIKPLRVCLGYSSKQEDIRHSHRKS